MKTPNEIPGPANGHTHEKSQAPVPEYAGFLPVIAPLIMCQGVGDGKTTACLMAQAATIDALRQGKTLDGPTDKLECCCPILRRMAIRANDTPWWGSDEERTAHLRPLIPLLLDSRHSKSVMDKRAFYIADHVVRILTPMRLEWINSGKDQEGIAKLKNLPPVTDYASCIAAQDICRELVSCTDADADTMATCSSAVATVIDAYAYADAAYAANACACYDAYATYAQRVAYRTAYLQLIREVAAITE